MDGRFVQEIHYGKRRKGGKLSGWDVWKGRGADKTAMKTENQEKEEIVFEKRKAV